MTRQAAASAEAPLFLLGVPRSGTKLLRNLLHAHPRVAILPWETQFLPRLDAWVGRNGPPLDEAAFERLWHALAPALYFDYRRRQRGEFSWRAWRAACGGRFDAAGLFSGFARAELGLAPDDDTIWGDKSPAYIEHTGLIRRLYPRARFVYIIRDVRDYCLSIRKAFGKDVRRAAARWNSSVVQMQRLGADEPERLVAIRFEDLLADTQGVLARVCGFLGVEFSEDMLNLNEPVENLGAAKGRRRIVATNFGHYRHEFAPREVRAIERIAWEGMQAAGYRPDRADGPASLHPATLRWLQVKDGLTLIARDVEGRGLRRSALAYFSDYRVKKGSAARY